MYKRVIKILEKELKSFEFTIELMNSKGILPTKEQMKSENYNIVVYVHKDNLVTANRLIEASKKLNRARITVVSVWN